MKIWMGCGREGNRTSTWSRVVVPINLETSSSIGFARTEGFHNSAQHNPNKAKYNTAHSLWLNPSRINFVMQFNNQHEEQDS